MIWLAVAAVCGSLRAATYYVAKTGSDANPGTEALPWLTIRHAANVVAAGDTAWVKAGVYTENDTITFGDHAGTAADPIVLKSFDGWNTVINAEVYLSQKHIRLENFRLLYSRHLASQEVKFLADSCALSGCEIIADTGLVGGVGVLLGSGHLRGIDISGNTIHGFVSHGIYANQMRCGSITHNAVYDNASYGIQAYPEVESSEIAHNRCFGNGAAGIVLHGYYCRVRDNICHNNSSSGIRLYSDDYFQENHDNEISNNTCFDNNWCGLWISGHGPNLVRNNLCLGNWWCGYSGQLFIDTSAFGRVTLDYNCYWPDGWIDFVWNGSSAGNYGNFAAYRAATGQDAHGICADPLVVDAAGHDLHLTAASPCIDAGDPATPSGFDLDRISTPQGQAVDIGAHEYHTFHPIRPTRDSAPDKSPPAADGITFALAPNPPSGSVVQLSFGPTMSRTASVQLYDASGRLVQSSTSNLQSTMRLDLRSLPAGVYLVKVTAEGLRTTQKLVVTH